MKFIFRNIVKGEVKTVGERELSFFRRSVSSWSEDEYSKGFFGKVLDRRFFFYRFVLVRRVENRFF